MYTCLFCGKTFTPSRKRDVALYCSRGCVMRKNAIAARIPPRNCTQCGAEYQSKNRTQKYCSIHCAKLHHHTLNPELSQRPILGRFWARIDKTDTCWNWTRSKSKAGYGFMSIKGVHTYMHRFSYELHFGPIPTGLFVCHHCDNPACVRPDHLFLGLAKDNSDDKVQKQRQAKGAELPNVKLTPDIVRAIRKSPLGSTALARQYGVSYATIHAVRHRINWKHVT